MTKVEAAVFYVRICFSVGSAVFLSARRVPQTERGSFRQ